MNPNHAPIGLHVVRLLRHFDRHKDPSPDFVASVVQEIDDFDPDTVGAAVSMVIRQEPELRNPVYHIRAAASSIRRGAAPARDPLAGLDEEGRRRWRKQNAIRTAYAPDGRRVDYDEEGNAIIAPAPVPSPRTGR